MTPEPHPNRELGINIEWIDARRILDSRGFPTLTVDITLTDGTTVSGSAPAGASTGAHEAVELRDGGSAFRGKGVDQAVTMAKTEIAEAIGGKQWATLDAIDATLRAVDGGDQLARVGANTAVATSIAAARAFAHVAGEHLYSWISKETQSLELLPVPHFNVLNGGAHATNGLAFQEFMIAPVGALSEAEAVATGSEVYHALRSAIAQKYGSTGLGDEGGFAPPVADPKEALTLLVHAIEDAGFTAAVDGVAIALDPAANGFYDDGIYRVGDTSMSSDQLGDYYMELLDQFPIRSLEDGFAEDDLEGWTHFAPRASDRVQIVGDDLYVTDPARIRDGAQNGYSNSVLIKPNQIGTVSDTLTAIATAREEGMSCMISHRSGETLDPFIADLAVGTGVGQIKSGAPARGERVAKYNRLTDIEAENPALRYGLRP